MTASLRLRRGVSLAGTLGCMTAIFLFSSQNGESSGRLSGGISAALLGWLYGEAPSAAQTELFGHLVRKAAHFSIYALLGAFLASFFLTFDWRAAARFFLSVGTACLYALGDEWHQSLVPGRGPSLWDVALDTAGAAVGTAAVLAVCAAAALCRRRRAEGPRNVPPPAP